jgi:hypothetical protein
MLHPSRLALGPTQSPIQWVSGLWVKWPGHGIGHPPPSSAEVTGRVELHLLHLWAFVTCCRVNFTLCLSTQSCVRVQLHTFTSVLHADSLRPISHYRDNHVPATPSVSLQYAWIGVPTSALTFKARYNYEKCTLLQLQDIFLQHDWRWALWCTSLSVVMLCPVTSR